MRIIQKHPGQLPQLIEIEEELEGMQAAIGGGHIELVRIQTDAGELDMYCDDEGKLKGLVPNVLIAGDIVCGTVIVCAHEGPETVGLDASQAIAAATWCIDNGVWF